MGQAGKGHLEKGGKFTLNLEQILTECQAKLKKRQNKGLKNLLLSSLAKLGKSPKKMATLSGSLRENEVKQQKGLSKFSNFSERSIEVKKGQVPRPNPFSVMFQNQKLYSPGIKPKNSYLESESALSSESRSQNLSPYKSQRMNKFKEGSLDDILLKSRFATSKMANKSKIEDHKLKKRSEVSIEQDF